MYNTHPDIYKAYNLGISCYFFLIAFCSYFLMEFKLFSHGNFIFSISLTQSPSAERSQNGSQPGSTELRRRETRANKPGSPSLQDPYSLYKYDKVTYYRKVPKFSDARKLCCNLPKSQTKRPNLRCKWNSKQ